MIKQKVGSISDLLGTMKLLCLHMWTNDVTAIDELRLDMALRMLKSPHFNARMNALKEVSSRLVGPCRVGSVGSVSASLTVGREFASRPGHTKDHHTNGTNCLPA